MYRRDFLRISGLAPVSFASAVSGSAGLHLFQEGRTVTVDVYNETDVPEVVHWHGQRIAPAVDGSVKKEPPPWRLEGVADFSSSQAPRAHAGITRTRSRTAT